MSDYLSIEWVDNKQVEARIRELGIEPVVRKYTLAELNVKGSRNLQTRLVSKIDEKLAETLLEQISFNRRIERLVCIPPDIGFSGQIVADGNHRTRVIEWLIELGDLPEDFVIEVYFVDTNDKGIQELVARSFNCIEDKKTLTEAERISHIQYMMTAHANKWSLAVLAKHFGVKEDIVKRELMYAIERQELRAAEVPVDNLTDAHLKEIHKIRQNDPLKHKLAKAVAQYKPTAEDTRLCVNKAVQALTKNGDAAAISVIAEFRQLWADDSSAKSKNKRTPNHTALNSLLGKLNAFLSRGAGDSPFETFEQMGIADTHLVANLRRIWKADKKILDSLFVKWDADHKNNGK
jgi:hypothetical protein